MDLDLLSDFLAEPQTSAPRELLSDLPNRSLTLQNADSNPNPNPSSNTVNRNSPGAVISKIEDIFEAMTDCLLGERKELVIQLKTGRRKQKSKSDADNTKRTRSGIRTVTFPNKSPHEAWKFTALLRILELSHEALVTGIVTTKRDIYYRDPELFLKQAVVDQYVDDIAYTLGVERDALNVVAAAKGLVSGSFTIIRKDNSVVDYSAEPGGLLIPDPKNIQEVELEGVKWILVIEKEACTSRVSATFRTLATEQYWKGSRAGKGILITAKGYPDIQTRQFLRLLSTHAPEIPILALVDFDADGIGIMSTYKSGSAALAHESATLAVPSIQWLGVRSCDFLKTDADVPGLLKLTARDRRIAVKMLEREMEEEWRRELQVMLMLDVKAEIQVLGNGERLGEWLDGKLLDAVRID
ncbi:Meiotic recombination protein rec12 [Lachnellula suecica]|uniref:DNA topoisomerase (ATP-hydrolyzing) n=1 Tax=Lachnellula suecica TaxID=602035 RepID=A0A8T9CAD9_9HELO|nr:Meiotic recombination protein rec12 [Lachnellula suecica]